MVILWSVVQAGFVRVLLLLHSLMCIWRAVTVSGNTLVWLLATGNVLHMLELEYRIIKRRGEEGKWFCPCFFIHLLNTIPAIWIVEFDRLKDSQAITNSNTTVSPLNTTEDAQETLLSIEGITIPIKLDADTWASVLEQGFLFILILGRWILPRGKLTRDQLSQLLFMYIGSGSDVVELFIIFEEPAIRSDKTFAYAILAVWTVSLLQFAIVLVSTRKGRLDEEAINTPQPKTWRNKPERCFAKMVEMEIWSLFVTMLLQDGPYLIIRLCAIIVKRVTSYGIIFFASKNVLMIMMLVYRVLVVGTHEKELERKESEKEKEELKMISKTKFKYLGKRLGELQNQSQKRKKGKGREKYGLENGPDKLPPPFWPSPNYYYNPNSFRGNPYSQGYY